MNVHPNSLEAKIKKEFPPLNSDHIAGLIKIFNEHYDNLTCAFCGSKEIINPDKEQEKPFTVEQAQKALKDLKEGKLTVMKSEEEFDTISTVDELRKAFEDTSFLKDFTRSRKEKPPRSARRTMRIGGGDGNAKGILVIGLAILTVVMCIIGLLQSLK